MAWVKLDDQAPRNAKLLKAGPAAAWMWVCGIAHCQAHLSEGFIAEIAIPMIGVKGHERSHKLAAVLVDCGLFERVEGGYQVHDYLDFNETKEEALARKTSSHAAKVAAGRAGGIQSGINRSNEAKAKQVLEAKRSPDQTRPDRKDISQTLFVPKRADCTYCGATPEQTGWALELDHFKPRRAGGSDEPSNLVVIIYLTHVALRQRIPR